MDPQARNYEILASALGWMGGAVAATIAVVYWLHPGLLRAGTVSFITALLAAATFGFFLSAHQLMKRHALQLSTLVLTLATAATIILIIAQTGGLDSPYYALWLLAIIISGIFGTAATIGTVAATSVSYLIDYLAHRHGAYPLSGRLIQLVITLAAAAIAEWIHNRTHRVQTQVMANLSGQLGQEQLKAQALMSAMGEGVIVVSPNRQVQLFNRAAQVLTGRDEHSAQGLDYRAVLGLKTASGEDLDDTTDPFMKAWHDQATQVESNLSLTDQAGRRIAITMTVSPIRDDKSRISGAIALFSDITAKKEVERQRDEFISTASHEMRTPIAAIEGYLSLAMNSATATIDERAAGYLGKAHQSIGHLGNLFKDLLDVTKLEDQQLQEKLEPTDISALVRRATDDMRSIAQKKGLVLELKSGNETSTSSRLVLPIYTAMVNPERLLEVVMNLIDNAIKYTPAGHINVNLTATNDTITVSVEDSGNGIASEDLPHLFQKFYRVDSSATRTIGGTGLGLYICRTVIELYNGQIWVESKLGRGSTFSFRLPRIATQPAPLMTPHPLADPPGVATQPPRPQLVPTAPVPTTRGVIDGPRVQPAKVAS